MYAASRPRCEARAVPTMEIPMKLRATRGGAPPRKREGRPLTKRPFVVSSVAMIEAETTQQMPRPSIPMVLRCRRGRP
jgi:hypothetical protein